MKKTPLFRFATSTVIRWETHALPRGLPNVLIEVRQDLIGTEPEAVAWADRLADALLPILADDGLYRRFGED